jgi:F0F1-type ATP synthase membrane subunit b/b'
MQFLSLLIFIDFIYFIKKFFQKKLKKKKKKKF